MEIISQIIDFFLHLDKHLAEIISTYGTWTYLILFMIIFMETGLVITPFLPGDSLLFAAGTFASLGEKAFSGNIRFLKKEYLDRTHDFYERHGGKTIILARFIPIIRTFAPFVAGVGEMSYSRFLTYNVVGGILWVGIFVFAGYFFGNIPFVRDNFSVVILAIIVISVLPGVFEFTKERLKASSEVKTQEEES